MGRIPEEVLLALAMNNSGGGGGGTTNYNDLENKPKIAGTTLSGNKSLADLGIASATDLSTLSGTVADKVDKVQGKGLSTNDYDDTEKQKNADNATAITGIKNGTTINDFAGVESALNGKQGTLTAGDYIDITNGEISVNPVVPNEDITYEFKTKSASGGDATVTLIKKNGNTVISSTDYDYNSVMGNKYITVDNLFYFGYSTTFTASGSSWGYKLLVASEDHAADYTRSWSYSDIVDYTENFTSIDHSGECLVLKSQMDSALAGKQDTLTFDTVPTDGSTNPVQSNGVYDALVGKQNSFTSGDYLEMANGVLNVTKNKGNDLYSYKFITTSTSDQPRVKIQRYINGVFQSEEIYNNDNVRVNPVTLDGLFTFTYGVDGYRWQYTLLANSHQHNVGEVVKWMYNVSVDSTESFDVVPQDTSKDLVLKEDMDTALALKQNATDNSLDTDAKTIVGAINEHEGDIGSLKSGLTTLETDVEELQAYTGYSSTDIIGVEVDYVNKSFRRLGAAVGKNGGSDFDAFPMFGGRRRCNVADDGTISKYYGDTGYAEDGSNGQVMVYQPKFYYKVVPLKLEKQSTGKGYHIRKAAYYVTATPMKGFKVHPAFVNASGDEVDYILIGASKGCIYDVSESAYILDDAQVMDNTADKFSSIFGAKPASGLSQDLTRPKIEQMCQNRGANWHELNVQMASMTQLLMLIEYGKFDMQRAIGKGVVDITDNSSYNCGATSGSTSALGNASGRATSTTIVTNTSTTYTDNGKTSVTYRGEEDPYGDMWEFVIGMNIYGNGSMNGGEPYICSDYDYAESKNTGNYKGAGFTVANSDGYVNAWGYGSEDFDWLFIASEVGGSDALPVGDYLWKTANLNGYRIARLGAGWTVVWMAGGFCWSLSHAVGLRDRNFAGRLAYIPA